MAGFFGGVMWIALGLGWLYQWGVIFQSASDWPIWLILVSLAAQGTGLGGGIAGLLNFFFC